MSISHDDIEKIRAANDIVDVISERVQLKQKGADFWGCCPIHNEKTPSFKADPRTQLWHCFGCDNGGDVFNFIMQLDGLTFPEAARKLADRANIQVEETKADNRARNEKNRLKEALNAAREFYHLQLMRSKSKGAANARSYLSKRGFGGDIPRTWELGYAPGGTSLVKKLTSSGFKEREILDANLAVKTDRGTLRDRFFDRVMFPINDANGECIAFGGRILGDGSPKYLNSQETKVFHKGQVLYGLDKAKKSMTLTSTAIVVEGYTDVIAMHEAGLTNTVATLGTALTSEHIQILRRHAGKRIVYLFDGDEAGQRAIDRALQFVDSSITPEAGRKHIELCAMTIPDDLDPAEFISEFGGEAMKKLVDEASPLIKFGIERRIEMNDTSTPEGRAKALLDALEVLVPIHDSILAKDYAAQIADRLNYRIEDAISKLEDLHAERSQRSRYGANKPVNPATDETASQDMPMQAKEQKKPKLTSKQRSRRRLEQDFLGLCAQYPQIAIAYAEALESDFWSNKKVGALANSIIEFIVGNLEASATDIIANASGEDDRIKGMLTRYSPRDGSTPEEDAQFLSKELEIAYLEDQLAEYRSNVDDDPHVFDKIVEIQGRIADLKAR